MHVLSMRTPISVPSIKYSLQCVATASAMEADGASAVTRYCLGVDMQSNENSCAHAAQIIPKIVATVAGIQVVQTRENTSENFGQPEAVISGRRFDFEYQSVFGW